MPTIFPIRVTKSPLQLRLLDEWNVNEIENQKTARPNAMGQRRQHARFAEQDQNDSGNHRITDELIRPVHDEHTRRIPRRQCPLPFGRKPSHGGRGEDKTQTDQSEPDHLEEDGADGMTNGWCDTVSPGDPNGNEYDNCERKKRDRKQVTQERSHSTALPNDYGKSGSMDCCFGAKRAASFRRSPIFTSILSSTSRETVTCGACRIIAK